MNFGVIGTGSIVEHFLEAASLCTDFRLYAIYSRTLEKGRDFAKKYGASLVFDSLEKLAQCQEIDAVYIASPNSCHCEQAILMMENKKHVLCEKPISSNLSELRDMLAKAEANQVVLLEAMRSAFDPGFYKIKEYLPKLGTIRRATLQFCKYSSRYDKFKEGIIQNAFNPELSNSALMDIGVYCVSSMVRLFGRPDKITANSIFLENGMEGAGTVTANYTTMQAELIYSKITNSFLPSQIQGEEGTMVIREIAAPEEIEIYYRDGKKEQIIIEKDRNNLFYEIQEFIEMIFGRKEIRSHSQYSLMEMEIMDEARRQTGIVFPADRL